MANKIIRIPVDFLGINIDVVVTTGDIIKEYNLLRKKFPKLPVTEGEADGLHASFYDLYPRHTWIFLQKNSPLSIVNHEILHCVDYISSYYEIDNTEFRAYLFEYISGKLMEGQKLNL